MKKLLPAVIGICLILGCSKQKQPKEKYSYDGIDVSHHQGNIDWETVAKDTSIQFVYIKATEGATYVDSKYQYNISKANKTHLKVGSYHYFRMTSSPEEQFDNIKQNIKRDKQDLIPIIDVETTDGKSAISVKKNVLKLSILMQNYYGKLPIIYGTQRSYNTILAPDFNNHLLYIGKYSKDPPSIKGKGKVAVWQFTEKGQVDGINKSVDLCRIMQPFTLNDLLLKD